MLNKKQEEAVTTTEGPLLVLAGAGSGKTKVLTERIAYLIQEKGIDPSSILAITFTNKAAKEMKERVERLIGYGYHYQMNISTFHSFGLRIVRENYKALGYEKNFLILDSDDTLTLIKKIIKELSLDPKLYNPRGVRSQISGAKNEMVTPDEYDRYAKTEYEEQVSKIYKKYEKKLKQNSSLDFDDLLIQPLRLFQDHPDILKKYQEQFQYILIDEYQDTNQPQYLLSKMISAKSRNICVVGDNDQSIYSFRGANYRNILNFEKDYKDAKVVLLEENYRSTQNILNAANSVIKNNKKRKEKNLWSSNEIGPKIQYFRAYDEKNEAHFVSQEMKKLHDEGVNYSDMAVLYRTNAQSRVMEEELLKENLPYRIVGSFFFYNRKEIKDLISYLRLIYNSDDDISLTRVINVPKRGIGLKTIETLGKRADLEQKSLYDTIEFGKELEFKKIVEELKELEKSSSLTELVDLVLEKSGMRQALKDEKTLEADIRLENLEEFKSITKNFEESYGISSLEDFLMEISLVADMSEHKDNGDAVTLMTVHSVKGLEFDNVFVIGLEEGIFPHMNSMMESDGIEEERRLCYVAMTRAKKRLYFVNAKRRMLFGRDQVNPPSRFVGEVNEDYIDIEEKNEKPTVFKKINKKEYMNQEDIEYTVGEHVMHDTYQEGVVISINKSVITIAFAHPYGIKKLMKNHKSIHKM